MNVDKAYSILGINPETLYNTAYKRYRSLAKQHHPDKGGSVKDFQVLLDAWNTSKATLSKKTTLSKKILPTITLRTTNKDGIVCRYANSQNSWFDYRKQSNGIYKIAKDDFNDLYIIPDCDKVLQDNVNCKIRIVDEWQSDIEDWIVEIK